VLDLPAAVCCLSAVWLLSSWLLLRALCWALPAPRAATLPLPAMILHLASDLSHCASGDWIEHAIACCLQAAFSSGTIILPAGSPSQSQSALTTDQIRAGDKSLGMPASGLHACWRAAWLSDACCGCELAACCLLHPAALPPPAPIIPDWLPQLVVPPILPSPLSNQGRSGGWGLTACSVYSVSTCTQRSEWRWLR
jgi:hypothetical protein